MTKAADIHVDTKLYSDDPARIDVKNESMMRLAIHPGEILGGELEELGVSASELARQIEVPVSRVTRIIQGKQAITGDTALRLGHWFGTAAQFWLNLQTAYDLRRAEAAIGAELRRLPVRSESGAPPAKTA